MLATLRISQAAAAAGKNPESLHPAKSSLQLTKMNGMTKHVMKPAMAAAALKHPLPDKGWEEF